MATRRGSRIAGANTPSTGTELRTNRPSAARDTHQTRETLTAAKKQTYMTPSATPALNRQTVSTDKNPHSNIKHTSGNKTDSNEANSNNMTTSTHNSQNNTNNNNQKAETKLQESSTAGKRTWSEQVEEEAEGYTSGPNSPILTKDTQPNRADKGKRVARIDDSDMEMDQEAEKSETEEWTTVQSIKN